MRLMQWYLSVGMGFPAAAKAAFIPVTTRLLSSRGTSSLPSPSAMISNLSALYECTNRTNQCQWDAAASTTFIPS